MPKKSRLSSAIWRVHSESSCVKTQLGGETADQMKANVNYLFGSHSYRNLSYNIL